MVDTQGVVFLLRCWNFRSQIYINVPISHYYSNCTDMPSWFCHSGVYPSEILPHQLQIPTTGARKTPTESLSADIKSAIDNLPVGYSRIIRICRLVSKMLQPSNGQVVHISQPPSNYLPIFLFWLALYPT